MWIFLSGGLIMPSTTPMDEADIRLTLNRRDIQVRARLTEHLEYFRDHYAAKVTDDYSEIEQTPHMDYNCRFYMTKLDFAQALALAAMDIDYRKFKPTAEGIDSLTGKKYKSGAKYHDVLNIIWGSLLRLAPAGGFYGPKSKDNPNGYTKASREAENAGLLPADQQWWESQDYVPESEAVIDDILASVQGIPASQWDDYLSPREMDLVYPEYNEALREEKKEARRKIRRGTARAAKRTSKRQQRA